MIHDVSAAQRFCYCVGPANLTFVGGVPHLFLTRSFRAVPAAAAAAATAPGCHGGAGGAKGSSRSARCLQGELSVSPPLTSGPALITANLPLAGNSHGLLAANCSNHRCGAAGQFEP